MLSVVSISLCPKIFCKTTAFIPASMHRVANVDMINALEFHHENQNEKEFKLGSGNTISWEDYKKEAMKCILVCSNCHKEIYAKIGYKL